MQPMLSIQNLTKTYAGGNCALSDVNLDVAKGEILALLGPNGAGKTTMISIICGIVTATSGKVLVGGYDNVRDYRQARSLIGLVPQELTTDAFETPWDNLSFSRGLFGLPSNPALVEKVLKDLSLWDKKDSRIMTLSGGMKRRLLIAKALVHEPKVLFLDEPTAGVDVELRQDMWRLVKEMQEQGVTVVLTTHYIEEAEAIADRVGIINAGKLVLVEDKTALMANMGQKQLQIDLKAPLNSLPDSLQALGFSLQKKGWQLLLKYQGNDKQVEVGAMLAAVYAAGIEVADIHTAQSSLEEIFIELLQEGS
ncbi:MAG: ABC transporter ATP-binding protein [Gammaproteobacteria bacterium]|nr:ABC transporter ATP-binding protein [Gammaproteobacteria bacterium]MCP4881656.1 ABC transporter ATP-binding protein [Gammaproteobacteria bacterium]MDP6165534.1 ABC transporter ATP-binding protein [Gammaproteobacteria bacterium]